MMRTFLKEILMQQEIFLFSKPVRYNSEKAAYNGINKKLTHWTKENR